MFFLLGTCGLRESYNKCNRSHPPLFFLSLVFSVDYSAWKDAENRGMILNELRRTSKLNIHLHTSKYQSLAIGNVRFDRDGEYFDFAHCVSSLRLVYGKVPDGSDEEHIRQKHRSRCSASPGLEKEIQCGRLNKSNHPTVFSVLFIPRLIDTTFTTADHFLF